MEVKAWGLPTIVDDEYRATKFVLPLAFVKVSESGVARERSLDCRASFLYLPRLYKKSAARMATVTAAQPPAIAAMLVPFTGGVGDDDGDGDGGDTMGNVLSLRIKSVVH